MGVHDNDASESSQPSLGKICTSGTGKRDEVFGVDIPTHLVTEAIRNSPYYQQYMNLVAKQPKAKEGAKKKIVSKAVISKKPAPVKQIKPALAKQPKSPKKKPSKLTPSRKVQKGKPYLKLVDEEEVQHEPEPQDEETNVNLERTIKMSLDLSQPQGQVEDEAAVLERALKMSLDSFQAQSQRPVRGVAIRERVTEEIQKLPDVAGKGKAIVTEEQATHSLLDLHKSKKKSTTKQFILQ
nr:hypothetical protein [Tanacetum cinerariifolium]